MTEKIGRNILGHKQHVPDSSFSSGVFHMTYRGLVVKALAESKKPLNVSDVARIVGTKNWYGIKTILMELLACRQATMFRSGRYMMFKLVRPPLGETTATQTPVQTPVDVGA